MKLEVYFDYACPYCLRGHEDLTDLLTAYPNLTVEWHPCEAHPRPEQHGLHSDWCAKGMMYARDHGADLMEYHPLMYRAALTDRSDIEDLHVISRLVGGLLDSDAFHQTLLDGAYQTELDENNRFAWETYGFMAVPSLRMSGIELRSIANIGLTKVMIANFLEEHYLG